MYHSFKNFETRKLSRDWILPPSPPNPFFFFTPHFYVLCKLAPSWGHTIVFFGVNAKLRWENKIIQIPKISASKFENASKSTTADHFVSKTKRKLFTNFYIASARSMQNERILISWATFQSWNLNSIFILAVVCFCHTIKNYRKFYEMTYFCSNLNFNLSRIRLWCFI